MHENFPCKKSFFFGKFNFLSTKKAQTGNKKEEFFSSQNKETFSFFPQTNITKRRVFC